MLDLHPGSAIYTCDLRQVTNCTLISAAVKQGQENLFRVLRINWPSTYKGLVAVPSTETMLYKHWLPLLLLFKPFSSYSALASPSPGRARNCSQQMKRNRSAEEKTRKKKAGRASLFTAGL